MPVALPIRRLFGPRTRTAAPTSPPDRRRAKRVVVWALLTFVALQLGTGLASEWFPRIRDPLYGDKAAKLRQRIAAFPDRPRVVMLGSSRTGFGFHGLRIEEQLAAIGQPAVAFNFGIPASGPVTHRLYLNRLIESGMTPNLLLVEVLPSMLADDPAGPLERLWFFSDSVTYPEVGELLRYGFPKEPTEERYVKSVLLPWYALRFQILSRFLGSWLPWQVRFDWSRGSDACGWGTPASPDVTPELYAIGLNQARLEYAAVLGGLRPGGGAVLALRDLLTTCREHRIPVRLVLMPEGSMFPGWYGPDVQNRLRILLDGLSREYDAPLIDARDWLHDSAFMDGHHMLRRGAEAYSDRLSRDVIAPNLRGGSENHR